MSFQNHSVFLIDHAWTYSVNEARKNLMEHDNLMERMFNLMSLKLDDSEELEEELDEKTGTEAAQNGKLLKINAVLENMWKFNQTYKILSDKPVK